MIHYQIYFFSVAQQPIVNQGLLIIETSRLHTDTPQSVGLLWTSDQPNAEFTDNTQQSQETDIHASGGIRTLITSKRAAADITNALNRAVTTIGTDCIIIQSDTKKTGTFEKPNKN